MSRYLRPGWIVGHLLVLISAVVCMRLAWWQLDRSEETDGTLQNVGYAILWPAFGVAFIYMWVKFLRLESERATAEQLEHDESLSLMMAEAEALTVTAAGSSAGSVTIEAAPPDGPGTMDWSAAGEAADPAGSADDTDRAEAGFVGIVGDEHDDDEELIAYNRALAALADKERRAR